MFLPCVLIQDDGLISKFLLGCVHFLLERVLFKALYKALIIMKVPYKQYFDIRQLTNERNLDHPASLWGENYS